MNFAILDDNKDFLETIDCSIKKYTSEISMTCFSDADSFVDFVRSNSRDLSGVFIDIDLGEASGFDIAERVFRTDPDMRIVYVTGYIREYCQVIFTGNPDIKPFAFLTKPLDEAVLFKILDMFAENKTHNNDVLIKAIDGYHYIDPDDICFLESCKRHVIFHSKNNFRYECSGNIKTYISVRRETHRYSHQSIYINLRHVRAFGRKKVVMSNGRELPVSQTYQKQFKSALLAFKSSDENITSSVG